MEKDPVIKYSNKDVKYGRKIGNGSFGVVFEGVLKGERIAIKVPVDKLRDDVLNELKFLSKLKHPNVVYFYGVLKEDSGIINLLFEFLDGDARNFVASQDSSVETLLGISHDIALGMDYIHDLNIIHRDLAARNVLVDSKNVAKIADFGISETTIIPYRWVPRECLKPGGQFSKSSDIWSFGVTLWEIWSKGEIPYGDMNNEEVKKVIFAGQNPLSFKIPEGIPVGIERLLNDIFLEEELRPSFARIKILLNDIRKGNGNLILGTKIRWDCQQNQRQKEMEGQSSNSKENGEFFTAKSTNIPEEGASLPSCLNSSGIEIMDEIFVLDQNNVKILSSLKENYTVTFLNCYNISGKKTLEILPKFKTTQKLHFWHQWDVMPGKCANFNSIGEDVCEDCIFKLPQMNTLENLKDLEIENFEINTGDVNFGSVNLPNLKKLGIYGCSIRGNLVDTVVTHLFVLKEITLFGNTPLLEKTDVEDLLKSKSLNYIRLNTLYGQQVLSGSFAPMGPDGKPFAKIKQNAEIEFERDSRRPWKMTMKKEKNVLLLYLSSLLKKVF